jgi:hypothetical protein
MVLKTIPELEAELERLEAIAKTDEWCLQIDADIESIKAQISIMREVEPLLAESARIKEAYLKQRAIEGELLEEREEMLALLERISKTMKHCDCNTNPHLDDEIDELLAKQEGK